MEVPNYSTQPNLTRILLPRIVMLLLLSVLLYAGVVFFSFAVFNKTLPGIMNYAAITAILILAIADIFLTKNKNKDNKIYFFSDRIEVRGVKQKTVMLGIVNDAKVRKNMYDIILGTGDIKLSNGQVIKNVNYPERIAQYIIQLIRRPPQRI